ncbi:hypothetical protein L0A91_11265 [Ornithinimicrobium sp. INDO-MA30-4]|nr:Mur ligase family protein [Ornithinimicrobium sp. INDO-MA30-4]UJH69830.1 hypothetical protein L0A91_11265 [Ornithinimicrobium sp. INDO-MA30-4]
MADARAQAAVVETSSHALSMDRVRAVEYDIAVWTNLTSEHLDFHKTMEGYFSAKAALVQRADKAVLNADDEWIDRLVELSDDYVTYSVEGREADWQASDIVEGPNDLRFTVTSPAGKAQAVLPMIGRFNVANALAALAAADQVGLKLDHSIAGLANFPGVAGRMEMVYRTSGQPRVIVDFAHTPPSLEKALDTVRVTTKVTCGWCWALLVDRETRASEPHLARRQPVRPITPSSPKKITATRPWSTFSKRWSEERAKSGATTSPRSAIASKQSGMRWPTPNPRTPCCWRARARSHARA